jgi:hypothetical protein
MVLAEGWSSMISTFTQTLLGVVQPAPIHHGNTWTAPAGGMPDGNARTTTRTALRLPFSRQRTRPVGCRPEALADARICSIVDPPESSAPPGKV